jgi:hypothetical protein
MGFIGGFTPQSQTVTNTKNSFPAPRTILGTITFVGKIGTATFTNPNDDFYTNGFATNSYFYNGNGSANELIKVDGFLDKTTVYLVSAPTGTLNNVAITFVKGGKKSMRFENTGTAAGVLDGLAFAKGASKSFGANDFINPITYDATGTTFTIETLD